LEIIRLLHGYITPLSIIIKLNFLESRISFDKAD